MADSPITVMQALTPPSAGRPVSNPYTRLLVESMPSDRVHTVYFRWSGFLTDRFDALHVHWPEVFIRHPKRLVRWAKSLIFLLFVLRLRVQRKAVVRTVHNLAPHEPGDPLEQFALRALDRATTTWIVLNETTPVADPQHAVLIPHGHYRDWYEEPAADRIVRGRLLAFGLIRAYKGMDDLVRSFTQIHDDGLSLHIAGKPDSAETTSSLRALSGHDARISLDLRFVPDEALMTEISEAEAVVLPYREVHNSGVALLALSMNRPVILRASPATRLLAAEFGNEWVVLFEGELSPNTLADAVDSLRSCRRDARVDMDSREWKRLASDTAGVYEAALQEVRRPTALATRRITLR